MNRIILAAVSLVVVMGCGAGGGVCSAVTSGGAFCIPDAGLAPAGQKLTFEIIDQCLGGCGTSSLACEVKRDGGTITLSVAGQVCTPAGNVACKAACALTPRKCEIPALEEGDYTIVSSNQGSQVLKVRDAGIGSDAGVDGCTAKPF